MSALDSSSRAGPSRVAPGPILRVENLHVDYAGRHGRLPAVRGVSLAIGAGEVVALVGESGSGKSTIALAVMGMLPAGARITDGTVWLDGKNLSAASEKELQAVRGRRIGLIPQDPMVALNPLHRIGRQVAEPLRIHGLVAAENIQAEVTRLLSRVGIPEPASRALQFPHEQSGGMRQRVLIASSLGPQPSLIVADEPTTALDVTVQKAILDDIDALVSTFGMSMLLITHDLAVASDRADRIIVLKEGRVVEQGGSEDIVGNPQHAYTRHLVACAPGLSGQRKLPAAGPTTDVSVEAPQPVLSLRGLSHSFALPGEDGAERRFQAVANVSLDIAKGRTLALVGESGSGKSTTARIALGLIAPEHGSVLFEGMDTACFDRDRLRQLRKRVQPVYQNPFSSLNPRFTVFDAIAEPIDGFRLAKGATRRDRVLDLMDRVGLRPDLADRLPGQLSGGQRQRVAIARALAPEPTLLICDEPVSALDVSIQAQILALLSQLQATQGLSCLFISHDLAVVRQVADEVAVMKDGGIVESGTVEQIFERPQHDYTRLLLASIPGKNRPREFS